MISAKPTKEEKSKEEKPIRSPKYKVIRKAPPKRLWEEPTGYYYAKQLGFSDFLASNLHLYGEGDFFVEKEN